MRKIVLTATAVLTITGGAFAAGSDHYGSNSANQAAPAADSSHTTSIKKSGPADKQPVVQGSDRNVFGR